MKKLFSILFAVAMLAVSAAAQPYTNVLPIVSTALGSAQGGTLTSILNGGTNGVLHGATNTYVALVTNSYYGGFSYADTQYQVSFPVATHPNPGIMVRYTDANAGATNANLILLVYQSFDGGNTYESKASQILTNAFPTAVEQGASTGFTNRTALFSLSVPSATHIGIAVGNTGSATAQDFTNLVVNCNLNNQTVWSAPAPR